MKRILGWILSVIALILYLILMIAWKTQTWGYALVFAATIGYVWLEIKKLKDSAMRKKLLGFVAYVLVLAGISFVAKPGISQVSVTESNQIQYSNPITVNEGKVAGVINEDNTVVTFAGIPYAAAPVGDFRWKEPQPAEHWKNVRYCDTYAPMAMQKRANAIYSMGSQIVGYHEFPNPFADNYIEAMSEDCLYLNVWMPQDAKPGDKLPVIFFIHGGSLNSGQTYFQAYNGETLASKGVIFVNCAYRLGVFGYLADDELAAESENETTGNYGLLDQIAALRWVNDNIEAFGGDASNITIAGESAGSSSVNALCVSPLAKGLFRRAIAESSGITATKPYHTFRDLDTAKKIGGDIKTEFGCNSIEELRQVDARKLVNTSYQNNEMTVDGYAIVEQPYLTYQAGNNNEEAVLGGYNGAEADVFLMFSDMPDENNYEKYLESIAGDYASELATLRPANNKAEAKAEYLDLVGMAWFGYSHYRWSEWMASENRPAYLYYFTKKNKALGDWHSGEMPYFYGNIPEGSHNYESSDYALSETIQQYIINFATSGNPNGEGLPTWNTYNENRKEILHLDEKVQMIENDDLDVFHVFDAYMEQFE